ncbi:uncharacterized protein CDAR_434641 [Caerostris darwini]|uniref:Uncharacterized protein n=1 Tax=Caerostris darwini TaxID=1538125 RepID=A0AAV4SNH8_9ARAC|nr:uncharacterized protein CDAR_434641 [Caerostris darwini]
MLILTSVDFELLTNPETINKTSGSKYVPPIFIDDIQQSTRIFAVAKIPGRISGGKLKVFLTTPDEYRIIRNKINALNLKSHTFILPREKQLKTVIRGLPADLSPSDVMEELQANNIHPEFVTHMKNRSGNGIMPLFLVVSSQK